MCGHIRGVTQLDCSPISLTLEELLLGTYSCALGGNEWEEMVVCSVVLVTLHQPGDLPSRHQFSLFLPVFQHCPWALVGLSNLTSLLHLRDARGWMKGTDVVPC